MDILTKVNASVKVYRRKTSDSCKEAFYMNGKFLDEIDTESVQAQIESSGSGFVFAVSSGMIGDTSEKNLSISIIKELKRYHDNLRGKAKDINQRLEKLKECVNETDNLIHSLTVGNTEEKNVKTAFAGLVIYQCKAAIVSTGKSRVYFLRSGTIKQLPIDYRKADRLLKAGIITKEQAEELISHLAATTDESKMEAKKTEIVSIEPGDMFLLCTNGTADAINDDILCEVFTSENESGTICSMLAKEALKKDTSGDIAVMVIKVEDVESGIEYNDEEFEDDYTPTSIDNNMRKSYRNKTVRKITSVLVSILLFAAVAFGAYKLFDGVLGKSFTGDKTLPSDSDNISGKNDDSGDNYNGDQSEGDESKEGEEQTPSENDSENGENIWDEGEDIVYYTVQKGDSLQKISMKFYNDPNKYTLIMEENNIDDPNRIYVEQKLRIPKER